MEPLAGGGFRATGALHADLTVHGVNFTPAHASPAPSSGEAAAWSFDAAPARWGCDGALSEIAGGVEPIARGNRVEYARAELREWYETGPFGIEQGFTLTAPPPCRAQGGAGVVIELRGGSLTPAIAPSGKRAELADGSGHVRLACDRLAVVDATGRAIDALLEAGPRGLSIRFDDRGASYPVTVDPAWYEQATLFSPDTGAAEFGYDVAIDGDTAIACVYDQQLGHGPVGGAALVFVRDARGVWTQQGELLTRAGTHGGGTCAGVALSGDTAVVAGYVGPLVFTRTGGAWTLQQDLVDYGWGNTEPVGGSISIDGDTLVSVPWKYSGPSNRGWTPRVFVRGANPDCAALSACCVSSKFSANASALVEFDTCQQTVLRSNGCAHDLAKYVGKGWCDGSPDAGSDAGTGLTWSYEVGISENAVSAALSGNRIILGLTDYGPDAGTTDAGKPYGSAVIYERVRAQGMVRWVKTQTLTQAAAGFGESVSISGDTVIVGAPFADPKQGIAFVYAFSGGAWSLQATLSAPDAVLPGGTSGATYGGVGAVVSIGGDLAVVGPRYPLGIPGRQQFGITGYVFARSEGAWTFLAEPSNELAGGFPHASMATDGTSVIVGAPYAVKGADQRVRGAGGSAFVYSTALPTQLGIPEAGSDASDGGCPKVVINGAVSSLCDPDETITVATGCNMAPTRLRSPAVPLLPALGAFLGMALTRRRARRSAFAAMTAGLVACAGGCNGSTTITVTDPDEDATITLRFDSGKTNPDGGPGPGDTGTPAESGTMDRSPADAKEVGADAGPDGGGGTTSTCGVAPSKSGAACVLPATITSSMTIGSECQPWRIGSSGTVVSDPSSPVLTIEPCVTVAVDAGGFLQIAGASPAGIVAVGTVAQPITFTSSALTPTAGDWGPLAIADHALATSVVAFASIRYAGGSFATVGSGATAAALVVNSSLNRKILLHDIVIANDAANGISLTSGLGNVVVGFATGSGNLAVTDWGPGLSPIYLSHADAASTVPATLVTGGTGHDGQVEIAGSSSGLLVDVTETWPAIPIPYLLDDYLEIDGAGTSHATLTIAAPNVIQSRVNGQILVDATSTGQGDLIANGTAGNPIVFTSNAPSPAPGDWQGILVNVVTPGMATSITGCTIEFAGAVQHTGNCTGLPSAIVVRNGTAATCLVGPTLSGNTISSYPAGAYGVDVDSDITNWASYKTNTFSGKKVCDPTPASVDAGTCLP